MQEVLSQVAAIYIVVGVSCKSWFYLDASRKSDLFGDIHQGYSCAGAWLFPPALPLPRWLLCSINSWFCTHRKVSRARC